ncbi:MAG: zinc-binding alcohol dehydrogenase [Eubacteriales bacterium]|nr:zinc-binding alcohol dehydrogenase [Eubacteriales bacterium]
MKILVYNGPGDLEIQEAEDLLPRPGEIKVKTLYSGVSHGTEMNVYNNLVPQFSKYQDPETKLLLSGDENHKAWQYPIKSCDPDVWCLGYSNIGKVTEIGEGVKDFSIGDIVFSASSHQSHIVKPAKEFIKLEKDIDPKKAVVLFNLKTTYTAILDAKIKLGDVVVVSGLGLLGQLCVQMAKLSGAFQVYGIDIYENRRKAALENGCDEVFDPIETKDIAMEIRKRTNNRGADVVMEVSGNSKALQEAIRIAAPDTDVIVVSWYQNEARGLYLGDEFHHNRIGVKQSQSAHVAPEFAHMYPEERRQKALQHIIGKLSLDSLLQVMDFDSAPEAYKTIHDHPDQVIQVVFSYENEEEE